jgi:hypothetical protein
MVSRTLYNWFMNTDIIAYDAYRAAIDSGKISESDSRTKLIPETTVRLWAIINLNNDDLLDVII